MLKGQNPVVAQQFHGQIPLGIDSVWSLLIISMRKYTSLLNSVDLCTSLFSLVVFPGASMRYSCLLTRMYYNHRGNMTANYYR